MKRFEIGKLTRYAAVTALFMGLLLVSPFARITAEENEPEGEPAVTEPAPENAGSDQPEGNVIPVPPVPAEVPFTAPEPAAENPVPEGGETPVYIDENIYVPAEGGVTLTEPVITDVNAAVPSVGDSALTEEPAVNPEGEKNDDAPEGEGTVMRFSGAAIVSEAPAAEGTEDAETALLSANDTSVTNENPAIIEPSENEVSDDVIYIEGTAYDRSLSRSYYGDMPVYYHYTDDYFADRTQVSDDGTVLENAYIYDESLSSMSSTMMTASWASHYAYSGTEEERVLYRSRNIQDLMRQLGFEDIDINSAFESDIQINDVMMIAGHKTVVYDGKEYTLIAIFPDSGTTDAEWSINVEIGDGDYHSGFEYGASGVFIPYLNEYITKHGITGDIKIWSTGSSRSAGISNMAGGLLDLAIDNGELSSYLPDTVSLEKKNIYIYTYGSPATVSKSITWVMEDGEYAERKHDYDNIHNLRNGFDLVIHMFEDEWGMDVFGHQVIVSLDDENIEEEVQSMCQQWNIMSGNHPENLTADRDFMTYDPETGLYHYVCSEYEIPLTGENMEEFTYRFAEELAPLISREYYKAYLQPAMELFFATTYFQDSEIFAAVDAESNRFVEEAKETIRELFFKGIMTMNFSELFSYLINDVNPMNSLPQIVINAFKATETPYNYNFETHEYTDELLDDAAMRAVIRSAALKAGVGVFDLLSRLRLHDVVTGIDIYQAVQAGMNVLSSGHTVALYQAWARGLDTETGKVSDIYQTNMTDEDAWGYRMVNLPEEGSYTVYVYDTSRNDDGYLLRFRMSDGEVQYGGRTADPDWTVKIGTGDRGAGTVLYLRPNHNYDLVFVPDGTDTLDLSIDEYAFHYYRDIFKPVNHITADTESGTSLEGIVLSQDEGQRQDHLVMHIGALQRYPSGPEDNGSSNRRLLAASLAEPGSALAEYTIEKAIQMLAVSGIDSSVLKWVEYQLSGDDTIEFSVSASEKDGYAFDGWYFGDQLIGSNLLYSAWLSFQDFGKTIVARYHAVPKPAPKPSPAPSPSSKGSSSGSSSISAGTAYVSSTSNASNTASYRTGRVNKVPNTADNDWQGWLAAFLCSVVSVFVSAFLLKREYC